MRKLWNIDADGREERQTDRPTDTHNRRNSFKRKKFL